VSFPGRCYVGLILAGWLAFASQSWGVEPLHARVLVFVPGYEGSQLYDPTLEEKGEDPPCVWGSLDALTDSDLYFCLRMPNPLTAAPMLSAGPVDVYGGFVSGVTDDHDRWPDFHPYTQDSDFFTFAYDWRQEIATVTAPLLREALEKYARIHEAKTGIPAAETRFILVAHSMGGLVARTFLSENPDWADRISGLYLVGPPNLGSVQAIKAIVSGPGSLKQSAINFPASLLNLLPNDVNSNITKLTAITRPSLYELLPFQDPRWECVAADGSRVRVSSLDMLNTEPWKPYWPTAELESKLFLNDWLKKRIAEGRKKIDLKDWEFCQDPDYGQLQKMLAAVREWRLKMGSLSYTNTLMTRVGEASRLRIVMGVGLKTPTGVITEGAHDFTTSRYTYEPDNDGDETVTSASVLDDLHPAPENLKELERVSHGKLMTDRLFLDYLYHQLSPEPMVPHRAMVGTAGAPRALPLAPGSSVP
jgi:pimeloyl-ACP methyl ester carboxylesterase